MAADRPSKRKPSAKRQLTMRYCIGATYSGSEYQGRDGRILASSDIRWDSKVVGLGLRVLPSGKKTWVLRYRLRRETLITRFAKFPNLPLDGPVTQPGARQEARRRLSLAEVGIDPFAPSFEPQTFSAFEPEFLAAARARGIRESTFQKYEEGYALIKEELGSCLMGDLTERQARAAFSAWVEEHGPFAAKGALRLLREALELAEILGYRPHGAANATKGIKAKKDVKRGVKLSEVQLERLVAAIDAVEARLPDHRDCADALRLILYLGARRREITELRWSEVDLENQCLRLLKSKTGRRPVALNHLAFEVLSRLAVGSQGDRVFPSNRHKVEFAVQYFWRRVREAAELPKDTRIHDLRHSWVTYGLGAGFTEAQVAKAVGHTSTATTRRYSHLDIDTAREVSDGIGAHFSEIVRRAKQAATLEELTTTED